MGLVLNNSEGRSKLEDEIRRLEAVDPNIVKPKLPVVTLKEMSYTAPSDEDIASAAERELSQYRNDNISSITSNSEKNETELNSKRDAYSSQLENDVAALDRSYAQAAESIDNDVLKRGLGRSSIAVGQKAELENEYMQRRAEVGSDYGKKISELDAEISSVSAKLEKALNDFNIAYAAKLNETVNKLKTERDEKIAEVEKYNNDVRYKQAQLDDQRAKTESKLYSDALSQRAKENSQSMVSDERQDEIYKSIYNKMDEFLGSMSAENARLEIKNHTFYRQHLSDYYYYRLYDKYGR